MGCVFIVGTIVLSLTVAALVEFFGVPPQVAVIVAIIVVVGGGGMIAESFGEKK